jgi:hypothetical protein
MKLIPAIAPVLAIAGLAACAPVNADRAAVAAAGAGAADGRQCIHIPSVNSFSTVDRNTVNVRVGVNEVYQLELLGTCRDIDWNLSVGLRSRGGGSFACSALGLEVISPSNLGPDVCPVTSMRRLSDVEVAALSNRDRP